MNYRAAAVFSPDEKVEEETRAKDDSRVQDGRNEGSTLPFDALESLVQAAAMIAADWAREDVQQNTGLHERSPWSRRQHTQHRHNWNEKNKTGKRSRVINHEK